MLSLQLLSLKEKRGTMFDPEVLSNLYLDFKNSKDHTCHLHSKFMTKSYSAFY